jgi:RecA-family ATPase
MTAAEQIVTPPRTAWTATELMALEFPEPRWAIPGILAEGVTLLAGAPKIGKSWLALNVSASVAAGGKALGRVDVDAGDVLYLALEDNPRRLQDRLRKVLAGSPASERLTFAVMCEPLPAGGADRITAWLDQHPQARLVVVDVFARVRGMAPPTMSSYDADYLAMGALKRIADRYGVAVLVVHHTRKASAPRTSQMPSRGRTASRALPTR